MALDATVGGASANSYVSVADADAFFANSMAADKDVWDDTVTEDKELALIAATRELETYSYVGERATTTQALEWPRELEDDELILDRWADNVIPKPLKDATCLWAVKKVSSKGTATGSNLVKSLKIGQSVQVGYDTFSAEDATIDFSGLPIEVARLLIGLRMYAVVA